MRILLTQQELRYLRLVEYLHQKDRWYDIQDICKDLSISKRILLTDIQDLNQAKYSLTILHQDNYCQLKLHPNTTMANIYFEFLDYNKLVTILDYLLIYPIKNPAELAEMMEISLPTCYRYLQKLNQFFESKQLDIHIQTSPLQISGNELQVRRFYYQLYTSVSYYYFPDHPKNIHVNISKLLHESLKPFQMEHVEYQEFSLRMYLSFTRDLRGFFINQEDYHPLHSSTFYEVYQCCLQNKEMSQYFGITDEEKFTRLFYPIFDRDFPYLFYYHDKQHEHLFPEQHRQSLELFESGIQQMCHKYSLEIENLDQLSIDLFNNYIKQTYIFNGFTSVYNKHDKVLSYYKKNHFEFYQDLTKLIAQVFPNFKDDSYLTDQIIITLLINWKFLANQLNSYDIPIRILIDNAQNYPYGVLMKEIIQHQLPRQVEIDVRNYLTDQHNSNPDDYHIIISNRMIPVGSKQHFVYCQNIFSKEIIIDIRQCISKIRTQRLNERQFPELI